MCDARPTHMELSRDEFKAASLAAPVGWAYDSDERWRKLAAWKWRELCEAGGGGDKTHAPSLPLTNRGNRTIAAAIAFTFWPDYFDKQANAARAFGAPPPLLSRRLPAVRSFLDGETPESFAIPPSRLTPYPYGVAVPRLFMPTAVLAENAELAARWQSDLDQRADAEAERRRRVRVAADAGDVQANAIMDKELARGKKRRDKVGDKNGKYYDRPGQAEKREAERKRQRLSKKAVRKGWSSSYRVDKDDVLSIRLPRGHTSTSRSAAGPTDCSIAVIIDGLSSRPELNGNKATAVSFDESKGLYNVEIPDGSVIALKPANVVADPESPPPWEWPHHRSVMW